MADVCGTIVMNDIRGQSVKNDANFTKKQLFAKAVRGQLNAQGRTAFASQNKFGTNSNVYNLTKVPNTNILLFTRSNCE